MVRVRRGSVRRRSALGLGAGLIGWMAAAAPAQPAMLRAARPVMNGTLAVPGLTAPVTIERDAIGVPAVRTAGSEADAMRALGFLHAQERFFQMDGMRRQAAGRVAEIAGPDAVAIDRASRRLGFETVARGVVERLDPRHRAILAAYVDGVNAGLAALDAAPIELTQLGIDRGDIATWTSEDTVLVLLFMFRVLNDDADREPWRGVLAESVPPAVFRYLMHPGDRFDTFQVPANEAGPWPSIPGPEVLAAAGPDLGPRPDAPPLVAPDVRLALRPSGAPAVPGAVVARGSNAWVVSGARTAHGHAILANDPHLPLTAPGIWYRAELAWDGGSAVGVTLPGSPGVLIGSSEHVAWGFTNTTGDFQDLAVVEVDPADDTRYRTPDGWEAFGERAETIRVSGADPVIETVRTTRWGPVVGRDARGRPLALIWNGLDPEAIDFGVLDLATARTLETALDAAAGWGGPSQNVMIAMADGRIGWTLSGRLPDRAGYDGSVPVSWAGGDVARVDRDDADWRPRVADPESGVLVTANHRTVAGAAGARIGGSWAHPGRAHRISARLDELAAGTADESGQLDIQLDTLMTRFLPYRDVVLAAFEEDTGAADGAADDPARTAALAALAAWDGRADLDATVVPLVLELRVRLRRLAFERLLASVPERLRGRARSTIRSEEAALRILETQPVHLRPSGAADWNAAIREATAGAVRQVGSLRPWGDRNVISVRHPLSAFVPALSILLDMPPTPQPGHWSAVRVVGGSFGASTRLVVAPGLADRGFCHIPAGQSGHPGMPTYRSSHADWAAGRATPLRSGRPIAALQLVPAKP